MGLLIAATLALISTLFAALFDNNPLGAAVFVGLIASHLFMFWRA